MYIHAGMTTETRSISPATLTLQDRWFTALEHRLIQVGTEQRPLHILGIHLDNRDVWIQTTPLDRSDRDCVIRCENHQQPLEVLANLCAHLASAQVAPRIIDARSGER